MAYQNSIAQVVTPKHRDEEQVVAQYNFAITETAYNQRINEYRPLQCIVIKGFSTYIYACK